MGLTPLELGRAAEDAASQFLKNRGYRILFRNYSSSGGEIDIICRQGDSIVFVEVKSLSSDAAADPEEHVNSTKQRQLRKAAKAWIHAHDEPEAAYRFDVVAVVISSNSAVPIINHIEDAFPG